jgi:hypothetical protein
MGKAVHVGLAALAVWGAGASAHAASPTVAAEQHFRQAWPSSDYVTEFMKSPDGLAVFQWEASEEQVYRARAAVMKNGGDHYVRFCTDINTAALNGDWSKIAVGQELDITFRDETETVLAYYTEKVARKIGVPREEVADATYVYTTTGARKISQPVIVDLETRAETPLAVAGADFLYWLNDDELVIGRETSGHRCVGSGSMEAIKYDVRTGEQEPFPLEDLTPLLNKRCTVGVKGVDSIYYPGRFVRPGYLNPPYTSKDWRLLPAACAANLEKPVPAVDVPSRGGRFENDEGAIYWVPAAGGRTVKVADGEALAASDDGVWLFVTRPNTYWDPPWVVVYSVFRLTWQ